MTDRSKETDEYQSALTTQFTARLLVEAALDGNTITYKETAERLKAHPDLLDIANKFFPLMMQNVANPVAALIYAHPEKVPLLTVLMVRESDDLPGYGAREGVAEHLGWPELRQPDADQNDSRLWERAFEKAQEEVHAYPHWEKVYQELFGEKWERP